MMLPLMAYTPFLDPLPIQSGWLWLLVPLAIAIAVVYKTIKLDDLSQLPRQATLLAGQIVGFMALIAAAIWLLITLL